MRVHISRSSRHPGHIGQRITSTNLARLMGKDHVHGFCRPDAANCMVVSVFSRKTGRARGSLSTHCQLLPHLEDSSQALVGPFSLARPPLATPGRGGACAKSDGEYTASARPPWQLYYLRHVHQGSARPGASRGQKPWTTAQGFRKHFTAMENHQERRKELPRLSSGFHQW